MKSLAVACPEELKQGIGEFRAEWPESFAGGSDALPVKLIRDESITGGGFSLSRKGPAVEVRYARKTDAFRCLGRLLGEVRAGEGAGDFSETPKFDMLGMMVDVSRNGVIRPDAAKALMRRAALMGINMMMLYAEDTYEVPGENFFGYLRGRYSQDELRDLDSYADALGIEIIPCIQTLGHFTQVLQWPAYADYRDTGNVILAGEDRTYALLEKMIQAASSPFRTRRIHIGMDEAHGLGTGRYRELHGTRDPFAIFTEHLHRVTGICAGQGLRPMIWSDMYFSLGSRTGDYYDRESVIPPEVVKAIPEGVELVYWDYYHKDQGFYEEWIDRHRALGSEPLMAGGLLTWGRFWAALPYAFTITGACMRACKAKGIREVFMTLWGDDGMECDVFSALPGLQFFAEHGFADTVDEKLLRTNFLGSCGVDYDDWVAPSRLDEAPGLVEHSHSSTNVSKWLLWQDTVLGLLDPEIAGVPMKSHYAALAGELDAAAGRPGASVPQQLAGRLQFPAQLARVLSLKCGLRDGLAEAYRAGDRKRLKSLAGGDLLELRREVDALWRCHRDMWLRTYKPFGLEVIEQRYGGLRTRLESLSERLDAYLEGALEAIPELEVTPEKAYGFIDDDLMNAQHARASTPSTIK